MNTSLIAGRPEDGGIRVQSLTVGPHPEARSLNRSFRSHVPLLKLRLEIEWEPPHPEAEMRRILQPLLALSPSLRDHTCRGDARYGVLRPGEGKTGHTGPPFEAPLALAHLIEHLIMDIVAFVLEEPKISGATGAPLETTDLFDVFVEAPDPAVAGLAVHLSLAWVVRVQARASLDGLGRATLEAARYLYRERPHSVHPGAAATALSRTDREIRLALTWLESNGFARRDSFSMNFSDVPHYRVASAAGLQAGSAGGL